jgi:GNAT superfamily N-acetyltransferase
VGATLLDKALRWTRKAGYLRMTVSFEPMNVPASRRFWMKYFQPVCDSLVRIVDKRMEKD